MIKETQRWTPKSFPSIQPLYEYLKQNDVKDKGWLRQLLPFKNNKKHLNQQESVLLTMIVSMFKLQNSCGGHVHGYTRLIANAFAMDPRSIQKVLDKLIDI